MPRDRTTWRTWIDPLRPDEPSRRRMRKAIFARAAALLEARRLATWQDVAAGWAGMLVPIAAVLLLFFVGLAYQATPRAVAVPRTAAVTLEDLLGEEDSGNGLDALAASAEPSPDWALATVIRYAEGAPEGGAASPASPVRR